MKRIFFLFSCIIATTLAYAKSVQITIQPAAAQRGAQVFEKGSPISGSNGVFRVEVGLFQEKTLTIKADGFDDAHLFISFKHKQDSYEVTLQPNRKTAVVSTNVMDATIYIDGIETGKGNASFNIYKNSYKKH